MLTQCSVFFFLSTSRSNPPPHLFSDFCSDYICLQTCLRQRVVRAGGRWQEGPLPLQPVALALPATDTWISRVPAQWPRATNTWTGAALSSLPRRPGPFPRPPNVGRHKPGSHYHLPTVFTMGADLNVPHITPDTFHHISPYVHFSKPTVHSFFPYS